MKRGLVFTAVLLLLMTALTAYAQQPNRPEFRGTFDINTGDQHCDYFHDGQLVQHTFTKRWVSPFNTTVYLHRVESYRSIGGTLAPQAEGFSYAIHEQTGERIAMMPGQMKWPETTQIFVNIFEGVGPLAVEPGDSILVVGTCVAYGANANVTLMKWVVTIWLYEHTP